MHPGSKAELKFITLLFLREFTLHPDVELLAFSTPLQMESRPLPSASEAQTKGSNILELNKVTLRLLRSLTRDPLQAITFLDLSYINLFGIDQLAICKNLQIVILRGNQINAIPNLEGCPSLWKIDLSCNHVKTLNGLSRFSSFGTLVLCNNELSWHELAKIRHMIILHLHLIGNSKLEEDLNYRKHVIDCLPLLWTLDNEIITYKERRAVRDFFEQSTLSNKPVRHKLPRRQYIPTHMRNLTSAGVYGMRTVALMKSFGKNETHNHYLDVKRVNFLAKTIQDDANLEFFKDQKHTSITDLFEFRAVCREKCNMLTVLLMSSLVFSVPAFLMEAAIEIANLSSIGNISSLSLFSLPKPVRAQLTSILISATKVDREEQIKGGLDDKLFRCLKSFVKALTVVTYGEYEVKISLINQNTLASELVQLFCLVPTFFHFLDNEGVKEILISSTRNVNISSKIQECIKRELSNPHQLDESEMHGNVMAFIIKQMELARSTDQAPNFRQKLHVKGSEKNRVSSTRHSHHQRSCLTPGPKLPRCRPLTAPGLLQGCKKHTKETGGTIVKQPVVGDYVITGPQRLGRILGVPDTNVALVQVETLPKSRYRQADVNTVSVDLDDSFVYVNLSSLSWNKTVNSWEAVCDERSSKEAENMQEQDSQPKCKQNLSQPSGSRANKHDLDGINRRVPGHRERRKPDTAPVFSDEMDKNNFESESQNDTAKVWRNYTLSDIQKDKDIKSFYSYKDRNHSSIFQDPNDQQLQGMSSAHSSDLVYRQANSYYVQTSMPFKSDLPYSNLQKQGSARCLVPNYISIVPPKSTLRKSNWLSEVKT